MTDENDIEKFPYSRKNPPVDIEEAEEALDAIEAGIVEIEFNLENREPSEDFSPLQFEMWRKRATGALIHFTRKEKYLRSFIQEKKNEKLLIEELNQIDDYTELLIKQIGYERPDYGSENALAFDMTTLNLRNDWLQAKKREVYNELASVKERGDVLGVSRLVTSNSRRSLHNLLIEIDNELDSIKKVFSDMERSRQGRLKLIREHLKSRGRKRSQVHHFLIDMIEKYGVHSKMTDDEKDILEKVKEYLR